MGPQHPSTHGVLRLILEIDGETVTEARCGIGYLHTGIEKNLEFRNVDAGHHVRDAHGLPDAVLQRDGVLPRPSRSCSASTDQIPDRATVIRVLLMELNRLSSHLVCHRHRRHGARRHHDHDLRLP